MTTFTPEQVKWLDAVVLPLPKDQNAPPDPNRSKTAEKLLDSFAADEKRQEEREKKLDSIAKRIATMRDDLKEAQNFQVTWTEEKKSRFWDTTTKTKTKTMNWSEANASPENRKGGKKSKVDKGDREIRDIEVDTKHDLVDGYQVDPKAAQRVLEMHAKLVQLQTEMEEAVDDKGKPLFTARDIERELWSPLVKADLLPSNAVADKYSQEAQVFNGAAEVYEERLKEHSKKASKHETAQRNLRIAGDFVQFAGAMAMSSVRIAEFGGASMSTSERRELETLKSQDKTTPFQEGTPQFDRLEALKGQEESAKDLLFQQQTATLAVAFVSGVFDVTSKSLDRESDTKGWKIAESAVNAIAAAAVGAIGVYGTNVNQNESAPREDKDRAMGLTKTVQSLVTYGLAGSKIVFRLKEALDAPENGKDAFIKAMVVSLGDAIGSSFAAFDQPKVQDNEGNVLSAGTNGEWGKIGAYVSAGIAGAANIAEIGRILAKAKAEGREPDYGAIVASCGLNVIAPIMTGTYDVLSDKVRDNVSGTGSGGNQFTETSKEQELRDKGDVQALQQMAKTTQSMNALLSGFKGELPSEKELGAKVSSEANNRNAAKTKSELRSLSEEIKKDPKKKQALIDSIVEENEVRQAEINKLMELASATTSTVEATGKNTKAKAAMDALIAESEATKAKWAALDAITSGGVGILVSFLPAAGLAVAIRQLVSDVAWLIKKSRELNLWRKNVALTLGNDSVYGPALNSRLANAEIQVSQKVINVVFSLVGVTAESLKLGDITGAATAVSVGNTMARALSDFGFKMQKEAEIAKGWKLYKKARSSEHAGDRKLARKAMRWNSTLSKCVIAYGIVKDGDPIASEVARNCGLNADVLKDENDVCQRVVTYFMSVYSDDPVVLRRIPVIKDWHPAIPKLELENWIKFKAAALTKAVPPLAEASGRTSAIDTALAEIDALWKGKGYTGKRDELVAALEKAKLEAAEPDIDESEDSLDALLGPQGGPIDDEDSEEDTDPILDDPKVKQALAALTDFLLGARKSVDAAAQAFEAYVPVMGPCPPGTEEPWTEGSRHRDMALVAESLSAQAAILRSEIEYDIAALL